MFPTPTTLICRRNDVTPIDVVDALLDVTRKMAKER